MARLSEHCKGRKKSSFQPDIKEFIECCKIYPYNSQLCKHFQVSRETFYAFIDKEYLKQEQDSAYKSEYLDALKNERAKAKKIISTAFFKNVLNGDVSSVIFGMKTYNGLIEAKDKAHIALKSKEVNLKTKQFLTNLANEFGLEFEQLKEFADKHFKEDTINADVE